MEQATALEDAIDDGGSEVIVVQYGTPVVGMLVRGEDHRAHCVIALGHDVVEDVGRVGTVGQVADLVADQDVRCDVAGERIGEPTLARGDGEVLDELGGGDEEGVEAVLDRAVADGDGDVGLAAAGLAVKDERAAVGDEVGRQRRAEQRELDGALVGEVEVVDGLEEGEAAAAGDALDAGLGAMSDFLGDQQGQEVAAAPLLGLGASDEVAPDAARVGEVEALEQRIDVEVAGVPGVN